jgi:hypothetical protein
MYTSIVYRRKDDLSEGEREPLLAFEIRKYSIETELLRAFERR